MARSQCVAIQHSCEPCLGQSPQVEVHILFARSEECDSRSQDTFVQMPRAEIEIYKQQEVVLYISGTAYLLLRELELTIWPA